MSSTKNTDSLYTALFCEENIWQLADSLIHQGVKAGDLTVVYISNTKQQVALFQQKSTAVSRPVIWDYHVVLLQKNHDEFLIYDFDSRLDFPCSAQHYLEMSFPEAINIPASFQAYFRLIDASHYLTHFYTDRSHMLGILPADQFPDYPPVQPAERTNKITLKQLINFNQLLSDDEKIFELSALATVII